MSDFGKLEAAVRPSLRLVVDNELPKRDALGLRALEAITRFRRETDTLRGPGRAELDADFQTLRVTTLRIVARVAGWRSK